MSFSKFKKFSSIKNFQKSDSRVEKRPISMGEVSNRRLIALIAGIFILYIIFYPESPIVDSFKVKVETKQMHNEIERLREDIKRDCVIIDGITNNPAFLIRYAREKLYLSNPKEDVFVVID